MPLQDAPDPSPYPSPAITSSRRLTGPNFYAGRAGAVLEVTGDFAPDGGLPEAWEHAVRALLQRLHWTGEDIAVRRHRTGAGLFLTAPLDALLAATDIAEQAWLLAERGGAEPDVADAVQRLRVSIAHDRRPRLPALAREASRRALNFSMDDDVASVGSGTGVRCWPLAELPAADDWGNAHDVPIALVTGSNGKTTTVRLIAAMLVRAGHTPGWCCTSGVYVAGEEVAHGDYAGPAGARAVVQNTRVSAAVLETARGGILRRGLAVTRARVAVVTNVSEDHFGEYGVDDLHALGAVKLVVARALPPDGRLVLNADDAVLRALAPSRTVPVVWFTLTPDDPFVAAHVAAGGEALAWDCDHLVAWTGGRRVPLAPVADVPIGLGGHARYNLANALAASAAALALGVAPDDVGAELRAFGRRASDNVGRLALFTLRGATIVLDFVHNPDGWRALAETFRPVSAGRRVIVLGQAGDRDDDALAALARAVWSAHPSHVILKELPDYLRGRAPGETTAALARHFATLGAAADVVRVAPSEDEAIADALQLMGEGDLALLGVHSDFAAAVAQVERAGAVRRALVP